MKQFKYLFPSLLCLLFLSACGSDDKVTNVKVTEKFTLKASSVVVTRITNNESIAVDISDVESEQLVLEK